MQNKGQEVPRACAQERLAGASMLPENPANAPNPSLNVEYLVARPKSQAKVTAPHHDVLSSMRLAVSQPGSSVFDHRLLVQTPINQPRLLFLARRSVSPSAARNGRVCLRVCVCTHQSTSLTHAMGAAQSSIPTEAAVVGAIVAGGVTAYGIYSRNANGVGGTSGASPEAKTGGNATGKKGKGKKKAQARLGSGADSDVEFEKTIAAANKENAAAAASARVVRAPDVVPGTFDFNPTSNSESEARDKKARKKKAKKATSGVTGASEVKNAVSSSVVETKDVPSARTEQVVVAPQAVQAEAPAPSQPPAKKNKKRKVKAGASASEPLAASIDMSDAGDDASWTRVSTRKKTGTSTGADPQGSIAGASSTDADAELLTSDTNLTSGATDPEVTETEEEDSGLRKSDTVTRKTLAERLLPRPRKTGVEEYVSFH